MKYKIIKNDEQLVGIFPTRFSRTESLIHNKYHEITGTFTITFLLRSHDLWTKHKLIRMKDSLNWKRFNLLNNQSKSNNKYRMSSGLHKLQKTI